MFRIWLFGSMAIAAEGMSEGAQGISGRCAHLLAYLALGQGRYFSRAELQDTLWPERGAGTSGSFNTALWRLRRMIEKPPLRHGDLLVCDRRGAIGLNPEGVWLDVDEFERLVQPGLSKPTERLSDADIQQLRDGVALYKSDILLDLTDDWALRQREKHRRHYLNALGRLMQLATIRREYALGIGYAQAILDSDALREDVHRDLMQLFVLNGQRAQALRQFEHCRELLRRELAIQPMRETLAVYQRIADNAIGAVQADAAPMQAPPRVVDATEVADWQALVDPRQHTLDLGDEPAHRLIHAARRSLATADTQLQLSLQLMAR
ncbi:AfsR/SARP family transcriptional regulator [Agrilutibacter solisilvae]|uniref:Winged helix-turn-helix domain-containing protein n=1 Tax=Agrilutibacter solisilvae TaxID=2763317 RepID=A0A974XW64_9GAMM|nr:BTAD domain-containing putative transcriptional regulator [Lysobacter solisilvae]QSX77001.1 winged helix-turn-helix domain-containing protein [Lysobacter solisilvae]